MSVPSTEIAEYLKDPGLWYSKNGSKHRRPFPTLADLPHSAIPLNSQNSIPDPDNGEEKDFHKISSKHGQRRMKPLRLPVEPIPEIPQEFKNVRWDLDTEAVAGLERLGEYMRNPQDNDRSKSIGSNGLVVAATAANGEQVVVKISRRSGPLSEAVIDREAVFQRTASSVTDRVPRVIEEGILPFQTTQYNNGISEQRDYAVIVSQLVPGKNLFDINNIIARPLTVQNAVRIYTPLAEGIDALGHAGIVHRDIKPGNVVSDGKEAYLVDFGTATKIGSPGQRSIGSPAFYTPEHTKTEPEFSAATNAYQFGLFILRELTRKNDFMPLKNLGDPKSFDLSELLKAGTYYYYVKNWFDKNFVPYSWREAFFGTLHELPQYRPSATEFMSMLDKASKRSPGYNS